MKNNYPIRYAVMPIIAQTGWSHGLNELERKYEPIVYIPSKCYLVKSWEDYDEKGEVKRGYKVVFPYQSTDDGWRRVEPDFNYFRGECINGYNVKEIYKTYEEAQKMATEMNKGIVSEKIPNMSYDSTLKERIDALREDMKEKEDYYGKLASQIQKTTADLVVDAPKKEQTIVVKKQDSVRLRDISLYEFIHSWSNEKYRVYHLTEREFEQLKSVIQNDEKSDLSVFEKAPLIINDPKGWKAQVVDSQNLTNQGFYIEDGYIHYDERAKPLEETTSNNATDSGVKAYTIETYEDVITSYITNFIYGPYKTEVKVGNKTFVKKIDI